MARGQFQNPRQTPPSAHQTPGVALFPSSIEPQEVLLNPNPLSKGNWGHPEHRTPERASKNPVWFPEGSYKAVRVFPYTGCTETLPKLGHWKGTIEPSVWFARPWFSGCRFQTFHNLKRLSAPKSQDFGACLEVATVRFGGPKWTKMDLFPKRL